MNCRAAKLFLLAVLAGAAAHAGAATPQDEEPLAAALHLYERCHWAAAWERMATLADAGHPEAARIAMQMARFGPQLYGQHWTPAPKRIAQWQATARRAGVRTASNEKGGGE